MYALLVKLDVNVLLTCFNMNRCTRFHQQCPESITKHEHKYPNKSGKISKKHQGSKAKLAKLLVQSGWV